jgi:hypothetical protein
MATLDVHFRGGTYDGKGRRFEAEPALVLVIPVGDGFFERYRRLSVEQGHQIYEFVERFEGER